MKLIAVLLTSVLLLGCLQSPGSEPNLSIEKPPSPGPAPAGPPPALREDNLSTGIWVPEPGTSFQWQLSGELDASVDAEVYDIDLFDSSREDIEALHKRGRKVICYISAGSWEDWRPDKDDFPSSLIGKDYEGWAGEKWLDIRAISLLAPVMTKRLDLAKEKGCDGIEPDNIDAYDTDTGFPLTYQDQLRYNIWLANETHNRGMSIGLKNGPEQASDLLPHFDWVLTEDCFDQQWCDSMKRFVSSGKAVFMTEYTDTGVKAADFCPYARSENFTAILKNRELDAWVEKCP